MDVIVCVGETLEQRQATQTEAVLDRQLNTGLAGVPSEVLSRLSIAYEPVWAIGSREHHATPRQAHAALLLIRAKLTQLVGLDWSERLTIHYGGSVEPGDAAAFLSQPGIDGVMIGGESLKVDDFLAIVEAATAVVSQNFRLANVASRSTIAAADSEQEHQTRSNCSFSIAAKESAQLQAERKRRHATESGVPCSRSQADLL